MNLGVVKHTCHVLGPRQTLRNLAVRRFLCLNFRDIDHVVICSLSVSRPFITELNMLQEIRLFVACMELCVHFTPSTEIFTQVIMTTDELTDGYLPVLIN